MQVTRRALTVLLTLGRHRKKMPAQKEAALVSSRLGALSLGYAGAFAVSTGGGGGSDRGGSSSRAATAAAAAAAGPSMIECCTVDDAGSTNGNAGGGVDSAGGGKGSGKSASAAGNLSINGRSMSMLSFDFYLGATEIAEIGAAAGSTAADAVRDIKDKTALKKAQAAASARAAAEAVHGLEPGLVSIKADFHANPLTALGGSATMDTSSGNDAGAASVDGHALRALFAALVAEYNVPPSKQFELLTHIKLAAHFANPADRKICIEIRLVALSVLLLSHPDPHTLNAVFHADPNLITDVVALIGAHSNSGNGGGGGAAAAPSSDAGATSVPASSSAAAAASSSLLRDDSQIPLELKKAAFRCLQAFVQAQMRVNQVVSALGVSVFHGFLPELVRATAAALLLPELPPAVPLDIAHSIFMLVQLLCNYEVGCEALLSSGIVPVLLPLIEQRITHTKFTIRCARILEMLLSMTSRANPIFLESQAVELFIGRLALDAGEGPSPTAPKSADKDGSGSGGATAGASATTSSATSAASSTDGDGAGAGDSDTGSASMDSAADDVLLDPVSSSTAVAGTGTTSASAIATDATTAAVATAAVAAKAVAGDGDGDGGGEEPAESMPPQCPNETKSLLKALLKFLLSVVQEPAFATALRSSVEGPLTNTLKVLLQNAAYFGNTLWGHAARWLTDFCNNEPALLTVIQDAGVQDVILEVLGNAIPASGEVLADLPNLLSALALNARGLAALKASDVLPAITCTLTSPKYLSNFGQNTAVVLGSAMDELLRHQPDLKEKGILAVRTLLDQLHTVGNDESLKVKTDVDHSLRRHERRVKASIKAAEQATEAELISTVLASSIGAGAAAASATTGASAASSSSSAAAGDETAAQNEGDEKEKARATEKEAKEAAKEPSSLLEFVANSMRYVEVLLNNTSLAASSQHADELAALGGMRSMLELHALPNLPLVFGHSTAAQTLNTAYRAFAAQKPQDGLEQVVDAIVALQVVNPKHLGTATPEQLPFGEVLRLEEGFENTLIKRICTLGRFCELLLAVVQQHHVSGGQHRQTLKMFAQDKGAKCIELLMDVNERLIAEICLLQETFEKQQKQMASTKHAKKKKATKKGLPTPTATAVTGDDGGGGGAAAAADVDGGITDSDSDGDGDGDGAGGEGDKTTRLQQHLMHVHSVVVGVLSQLLRTSSQQQRRRGLLGGGGGGAAHSGEVANHIAKHFAKLVSGATEAVQESQDKLFAVAKESTDLQTQTQNSNPNAKDPRATVGGQRLALRSFHRVSSIVAQLKSYLFDPQRRSASKAEKFGKLNGQAWHALVKGGAYESFLELSGWMVTQLDFWGYGGAVAMASGGDGDVDDPFVNGAPPSKAELNGLVGKSFKTAAHASPLTVCDVNMVYAHGGGAWVCNSCDGQQAGRIAFHHGPSDYDLCPACFYRKSQSGHQRVLFKALTDALTLMAKLVEPTQSPPAPGARDAAVVKQERALQEEVRKLTAKFVAKLWSPAVLAQCDADLTKQVLIVVGNTVTAERTAARDTVAAAAAAAAHASSTTGAHSSGGSSMLGSHQLSMTDAFARLIGPHGDGGHSGGIRSASSNGVAGLANLLAGIDDGGGGGAIRDRRHSGAVVRRRDAAPAAAEEEPPFVLDQSAADMLVSMGFDAARAARVLEMTSNNLEAATELILMGGDLNPELNPAPQEGQAPAGASAAAATPAAASTPDAAVATPGAPESEGNSVMLHSESDSADDADDAGDAMDDSDDEEAMLARAIALSMGANVEPEPEPEPAVPSTPANARSSAGAVTTPSPAAAATSPPTPPGRPSGATGGTAASTSASPSSAAAAGAFGGSGSTMTSPLTPPSMRAAGATSTTPDSSAVPQLDLSFLSAIGGSGGGGASSTGAGASSLSGMQARRPSSTELSRLSQSLSGFLSSSGAGMMSSSGISGSGGVPMSSGAGGAAARAEKAKQDAEESAAASAVLIAGLTADALHKCLQIADRADIMMARIQLTVLQALHGKTEAEAAEALGPLATEVGALIEHILALGAGQDAAAVPLATVAADHQGFKLAVRLHLLTLLAAHGGTSAAVIKAASSAKLTPALVKLFEFTLAVLVGAGVGAVGRMGSVEGMPHYVTPLTVFLEQYDRGAVVRARDLQLRADERKKGAGVWALLQPVNPDEDYWGGQRSKWTEFSTSDTAKIEAAYCSGELSLDIMRHRQQFTIDFQRMQIAPTAVGSATEAQQVRRMPAVPTPVESAAGAAVEGKEGASTDSATGNDSDRPSAASATEAGESVQDGTASAPAMDVDAAAADASPAAADASPSAAAAGGSGGGSAMNTDDDDVDAVAKDDAEVVALRENALSFAQISVHEHNMLVASTAQYLQHHLDSDMLEATLRLAHRLTRGNPSALSFARKGGLAAVLALRQAGMMDRSTVTLCSLIIRHITDDAATLEQVIAAELRAVLAKCADGKAYLTEILTETAHMASRHPQAYAAACASVFDLTEDERPDGSASKGGDVTAGDAVVRARPFIGAATSVSSGSTKSPVASTSATTTIAAGSASATNSNTSGGSGRGGTPSTSPSAGVASEGLTMVLKHVLDAIARQFAPTNAATGTGTSTASTSKSMPSSPGGGTSPSLSAPSVAAAAMDVGVDDSNVQPKPTNMSMDALSRQLDATHMLPIFQPYRLLKLLGELVASYPAAVPLLMASHVPSQSSSTGKVMWPTFLMHDVILCGKTAAPALASVTSTAAAAATTATPRPGAVPGRDDKHIPEECLYASQLLAAFTVGPAAASSQGLMVTLLKESLATVAVQKRSVQSKNAISVADLINAVLAKRNIKVAGKASNPMSRLMVAAKVQAGLVALLRAADLYDPEVPKELNAVLRPLEVLTRFARAPARSSSSSAAGAADRKASSSKTAATTASPTPSSGGGAAVARPPSTAATTAAASPAAASSGSSLSPSAAAGGSRRRLSSGATDTDDVPADFDVHDVQNMPSGGSARASNSVERGIEMVERLADELADELGAAQMEVEEEDMDSLGLGLEDGNNMSDADGDGDDGDDGDEDSDEDGRSRSVTPDVDDDRVMIEPEDIEVILDDGHHHYMNQEEEDELAGQSSGDSDDDDDDDDDEADGSDDSQDEDDDEGEEDGVIMDDEDDDGHALPGMDDDPDDVGGEGDSTEEEDDDEEEVPVRVMHHAGDDYDHDDDGYMDQGFMHAGEYDDGRDEDGRNEDEFMMEAEEPLRGHGRRRGPHGSRGGGHPPFGMPAGLANMLQMNPMELFGGGGRGGAGAGAGAGARGGGGGGGGGLSFNHPMLAAGGHGRAHPPAPIAAGAGGGAGWRLETDEQGRQLLTLPATAMGGPGGGAYNQRASQLLQSIMASSRREPEMVEYDQDGQIHRVQSSRQSARAFLQHLVGGPLGGGGGGGGGAGGAAQTLATEHGGSGLHLVAEAGLDPMAGSSTDALSALPSLLSTLNGRASARREQTRIAASAIAATAVGGGGAVSATPAALSRSDNNPSSSSGSSSRTAAIRGQEHNNPLPGSRASNGYAGENEARERFQDRTGRAFVEGQDDSDPNYASEPSRSCNHFVSCATPRKDTDDRVSTGSVLYN